jgi:hypothetical protein
LKEGEESRISTQDHQDLTPETAANLVAKDLTEVGVETVERINRHQRIV